VETERFKVFSYDELMKRDKVSLDISYLWDDLIEKFAGHALKATQYYSNHVELGSLPQLRLYTTMLRII
jgi:hypothetical protein